MKRKVKISQREKIRRDKQRQRQWENDNPIIAHAIKNFKPPRLEKFMPRIEMFQI